MAGIFFQNTGVSQKIGATHRSLPAFNSPNSGIQVLANQRDKEGAENKKPPEDRRTEVGNFSSKTFFPEVSKSEILNVGPVVLPPVNALIITELKSRTAQLKQAPGERPSANQSALQSTRPFNPLAQIAQSVLNRVLSGSPSS